jgi:SAM-dependent methyltransferase
MSILTTWMDRKLYPKHGNNWDDLFRSQILSRLNHRGTVLDLGAGAGIIPQMNFRGLAARVYGVDPDPRVASNPNLDQGRIGFGEQIPFTENQFDLVFADNVFEHLADPVRVFREVQRVLKPGGFFLAKTPNRLHYVPLIAQATPHWFHQWINARRGRKHADSFPTRYLANTPQKIGKYAREAGLVMEETLLLEGRPEYLRGSAIAYAAGACYERLVNGLPLLSRFRVLLIATMRKPSLPGAQPAHAIAA